MRNTIFSVRLPRDLAEWLRGRAAATGMPAGSIVREQPERARAEVGEPTYMRHAGRFRGGLRDVSIRKGFAGK